MINLLYYNINSETFFDDNLNILGCNMSHADHASGIQRGRVCVYYKDSLPITMVNINCLDLKNDKNAVLLCHVIDHQFKLPTNLKIFQTT